MTTVTLKGNPIETIGSLPPIGSDAPNFIVTKTDLSDIRLKNYLGRRIILNIFPSLDTPTCSMAMKNFNDIAARFPDILVLCVSADLPFAQKRFCSAEHLENVQPVSVFRHPEFGKDYGVSIIDGPLTGLLSRAVLILDEQGKILYSQQISEITQEPDYNQITNAIGMKAMHI